MNLIIVKNRYKLFISRDGFYSCYSPVLRDHISFGKNLARARKSFRLLATK